MAKVYVISAFTRPCNTLVYLQIDHKTGETRFLVPDIRYGGADEIPLSLVASPEVLKEIISKSRWNLRFGHSLQTVLVSQATKDFINSCWDELKKLKPQFCVSDCA